jgi:hypothetical protein
MSRYFCAWTPLVIVGMIVLMAAPWLALVALRMVSLVAPAALVSAFVVVPDVLTAAISRRRHGRSEPSQETTVVPSPAVREPSFQAIRVVNTTSTAARSLGEPVVHISSEGVNR